MLKNFDFDKADQPYSDKKTRDLKLDLAKAQLRANLSDTPVIILIDGWESSGKGYIINEITQRLDTKSFSVKVFANGTNDGSYLLTKNLWKQLPAHGDFAIFDRSYYTELFWDLDCDKAYLDRRLGYLFDSEDALIDDGTIILKFFIHTTKNGQRKRIEDLAYDRYRKFLIEDGDIYQNLYYDRFLDHMDPILQKSSRDKSPWYILNGLDLKESLKYVLGQSAQVIQEKIDQREKDQARARRSKRTHVEKPILENYPVEERISDDQYEKCLEPLQNEARDLAYRLYKTKIPTIIVMEGVDAAGKGGAIRRLTRYIDPRSYSVNPTSAPSDAEKDHHYLWRFYNNFPKAGHMAIFDRSWYGRVMVERVEKLTPVEAWSRAYQEISNMERELVESGVLLIKYFLNISKDEQLDRFKDRKEDKPHKLTDEDWRNRKKWDENIRAIDEMLDRTSTRLAPWDIIPANQKKFARIRVLEIFIDRAREILGLED